ncbi:hypothetical protein D3C87_1506530 [compost metagenome]
MESVAVRIADEDQAEVVQFGVSCGPGEGLGQSQQVFVRGQAADIDQQPVVGRQGQTGPHLGQTGRVRHADEDRIGGFQRHLDLAARDLEIAHDLLARGLGHCGEARRRAARQPGLQVPEEATGAIGEDEAGEVLGDGVMEGDDGRRSVAGREPGIDGGEVDHIQRLGCDGASKVQHIR